MAHVHGGFGRAEELTRHYSPGPVNTIARLLASLLVLVPSYLLAQTQQSLSGSPAPARPDLTRDTTFHALGYSHLDAGSLVCDLSPFQIKDLRSYRRSEAGVPRA